MIDMKQFCSENVKPLGLGILSIVMVNMLMLDLSIQNGHEGPGKWRELSDAQLPISDGYLDAIRSTSLFGEPIADSTKTASIANDDDSYALNLLIGVVAEQGKAPRAILLGKNGEIVKVALGDRLATGEEVSLIDHQRLQLRDDTGIRELKLFPLVE